MTAEQARVLLVDDEEGVRMSLRALLDRDYQVSSVGSGEAAARSFRDFVPTSCSST
jgi:DNA-binding NtrC family response regulator